MVAKDRETSKRREPAWEEKWQDRFNVSRKLGPRVKESREREIGTQLRERVQEGALGTSELGGETGKRRGGKGKLEGGGGREGKSRGKKRRKNIENY